MRPGAGLLILTLLWAWPATAGELPSGSEIARALAHIDRHPELQFQRVPRALPGEADLGRFLFFDPRLSAGRAMSCATCHAPEKAFADGLPTAHPPGKSPLRRNTLSLLNVDDNQLFFWDGRVSRLEEQPLVPIQSPDEMGLDLRGLVAALAAVPEYDRLFSGIYGEGAGGGVSAVNVGRALAAFLRTLTTPMDSAFDRFRDDPEALSPAAQRGMVLFTGKGRCVQCHFSPSFTDHWFHQTAVKPRPGADDLGRYAVVPDATTYRAFRTPSLRNAARTAPYMHDGSLKTLRDVVDFYDRGGDVSGWGSHPIGLNAGEKQDLVAFLESMTTSLPAIEKPRLPPDAPPSARRFPRRLSPQAALPPAPSPAAYNNPQAPSAPPEPGPAEHGCWDSFSLEGLLRGMATGRFSPETERLLRTSILQEAIIARIYSALGAGNERPCSALRGVRGVIEAGLQPSAEFYCVGNFLEYSWIAALMIRSPDMEVRCRGTLDYNYRRLEPGDSAQVCSIIIANLDDTVKICRNLAPRFLPVFQVEGCRGFFAVYAPTDMKQCTAIGMHSTDLAARCRSLTSYLQARRSHDVALCRGDELCLALAGAGTAAAVSAEARIRDKACALVAPRTRGPR